MTASDASAGSVGFAVSPFADAVLTPNFSVQSTGEVGDRATPREGVAQPVVTNRPRPVIQIGRRLPMLTGRAAQLDELSQQIREGMTVEIFAAEGYGKTSLVNMLLHDRPDLKGYFADGVVSISGRTIVDGDLVGALFRSFFATEQTAVFDEAEMLRRLSPLRALIVLDDVDRDGAEFQSLITAMENPVFVVTSSERRLHDYPSAAVGPLDPDDLIAVAELRIGSPLEQPERERVLELSRLVDGRPRSWARAIGLIDSIGDLTAVTERLEGARDAQTEAARMALEKTGAAAMKVVSLLAELKGSAISQNLLATLAGIDDTTAVAKELSDRGIGLVVDDRIAIDKELSSMTTEWFDTDHVAGEAFDRLMDWTEHAEPAAVADEAATVNSLADWAVDQGRPEDVVELGRRTDHSLFRAGRWGAAATLLLRVSQAGQRCGRLGDVAWARHQMGVRDLALGDKAAAKANLKEAHSLRRKLGDKAGAALSKEHLRLLGPLAALSVPVMALLFLAGGGAVAGGAAVAVLALNDNGNGEEEATIDPLPPVAGQPTLTATLDSPIEVVLRADLAVGLFPEERLVVERESTDGQSIIVAELREAEPFIDRGLNPETRYRYRARVAGGVEQGPWSEWTAVTTGVPADTEAPDPPGSITATFANDIVTISWNRSTADDVAGYRVERDGTPLSTGVDGTETVDDLPVAGETHAYRVASFDETGNVSEPSETVSVEIPGVTTVSAPPAPQNVVGNFVTGQGLTLSWSGTADSYRVSRDGGFQDVSVAQPSFLDANVVSGETLTYQVTAVTRGRRSVPASVTLTAEVLTDPPVPSTPASPSVRLVGTSLRVEWQAVSIAPFAVTYTVFESGSPAATGLTATSFDLPAASDGDYEFTVAAVNSDDVASPQSTAVTITLPIAANYTVQPTAADFGTVTVGTQTDQSVTITNDSDQELDLGTLTVPAGYSTSGCQSVIAARGSCDVLITFAPQSAGQSGGSLTSSTEGALASLTGTGEAVVNTFALGIDVMGTGTGWVTSNSGGIDCPADCSGDFDEGTMVTLTADPLSDSEFAGWSGGGCSGTSTTCSVTMSSAQNVLAVFDLLPSDVTLTIDFSGPGSGSVTGPGGISCPGTCSGTFPPGTVVSLDSAAAADSFLQSWSVGCGVIVDCEFTINSSMTVTANFELVATETLEVTVPGGGTVTANIGGLSCPGTCSLNYAPNEVVTLTPVADAGFTFDGWSGGGCSAFGTGPCTITMDQDRDVQAVFSSS